MLHRNGLFPRVTTEMGKSPFLCYMVTHQRLSDDNSACTHFDKILEYYGKVPESILQCLTLYILPSLYGALGAILATMRYVRGRVAASLLTYIDRGRVQQDW